MEVKTRLNFVSLLIHLLFFHTRPKIYGVYANVPYFYDWVLRELKISGHTLPKPGKVVV